MEKNRIKQPVKREDLVCGIKPETGKILWELVALKIQKNRKRESRYAIAGQILDKYTKRVLEKYKQSLERD
jgi:hypothetical protein